MCLDNPEQERLAALPISNVFLHAPAGCGKTQALAERARAVIERGDVKAPRMILSLTFSNKAKENLANRMRAIVGLGWRRRITVTNFHGLSARIVKAHGARIGLSPEARLPDERWRRARRNALGVTFANGDAFDAALREAKAGAVDDAEVMARLIASGNGAALAYEESLRAEARLDYDDLIRHAARLLQDPLVARLYRAHFGMVLVDEVQDLSPAQFDIVRGVGGDGVTYAGDLAQGIYSFAGADTAAVMASIRALTPEVVELGISYRSTSAVLSAVNCIAREMGSRELVCGCPEKWPDGGQVLYVERSDTSDEAEVLIQDVREILNRKPDATVGVVCRRGSRLSQLQAIAVREGVAFEDWSAATHVPRVAELLRRHVRMAVRSTNSAEAALTDLELRCRAELDVADVVTADELAVACDDLRTAVLQGGTLEDAVGRCRVSAQPDAPVSPGLHLLTAHRGKGQEFDWVFVVGMERGHIPDFRNEADPEELRILHVMVSRAKYGLAFSYSRQTPTRFGPRQSEPSTWLRLLRAVETSADVVE